MLTRHRCLLFAAPIMVWTVVGANPSSHAPDDEGVPLPENERRQITTDLLKEYPDLAASPGIKFAEAPANREGKVGIGVYFYPHAESHGIKQAYRASCAWEHASQTWSCYKVVVRRYMVLPSQEFEVRVSGDISADAALALIEGSRRELEATLPDDPERPKTAIMITPRGDHFAIAWGTSDGYTRLSMDVRLTAGGDPSNPDDWHARILWPR